jgi:formylglycine-generating enzyme required for sulfatase activity
MRRATAALVGAAVCMGAPACANVLGVDSLEAQECAGTCATDASGGGQGTTGPLPGRHHDGGTGSVCTGTGGPRQVVVSIAGGDTYCIDATEVTNGQYATFLASAPAPSLLPDSCGGKTSFVPAAGWPYLFPDDAMPVVWVDWCDAYAFCAWAGKKLCGKDSTGTTSRWVQACEGTADFDYPYGDSYLPGMCNDHGSSALPVGTMVTCAGGYSGIMDMSGNVAEWDTSCGTTNGADTCGVRGGAFDATQGWALKCRSSQDQPRTTGFANVGFRCCSL